jgi:uncharacterized membrane protein YedE/YeeE
MDLTWIIDQLGESGTSAVGGLVIGLVFGAVAQRSRFCLRSATIEFWHGKLGSKTAIWLLAFGAALAGVQLLFFLDILETTSIRQLSTTGSMSGAVIGGLMFGAGMILARGCASRLLVLSATGNLRALITGLVLTVVAQASLRGVLSPLRQKISSVWLVDASARNMMDYLPAHSGLIGGMVILALAFWLAVRNRLTVSTAVTAFLVGVAVVGGWWFTAMLAGQAFGVVAIQSVSFTGPSADTLMALVNEPGIAWSFGLGLVPGVFAGSLIAASLAGDFKIQTFTDEAPLPRYLAGACLMGFGSMLAGGCAVGAGMTGGSVMAVTAWAALVCMWIGAGVTDLVVDPKPVFRAAAGACYRLVQRNMRSNERIKLLYQSRSDHLL